MGDLAPNEDKDELLGSFRRPVVSGREVGAPALAEAGGPPVVRAPAPTALPLRRPVKCRECGAEVLWVVDESRISHALNLEERQILAEPSDPADYDAWARYNATAGVLLVLWVGSRVVRGREAPAGVWGRESHYRTCPAAARRKP